MSCLSIYVEMAASNPKVKRIPCKRITFTEPLDSTDSTGIVHTYRTKQFMTSPYLQMDLMIQKFLL